MSNSIQIIAATLILMISHASCRGDVFFRIDADPGQAGIQTTRNVIQGEPFEVSLLLLLTDNATVDSFRLSIEFDEAALEYLSATELQPTGYQSDVPGPNLFASGVITPFEGSRIDFGDSGLSPANGNVVIGTIRLRAISGSLNGVIIMPFEDLLFDGSFDTNFDQITPVMEGATIYVQIVPEGSCATMVLGFAAIAVMRRSRGTPTRART